MGVGSNDFKMKPGYEVIEDLGETTGSQAPNPADNKPTDDKPVDDNKPVDEPPTDDNKPDDDNKPVDDSKPTDDDNKPTDDNKPVDDDKPVEEPSDDNKPSDEPPTDDDKPADEPARSLKDEDISELTGGDFKSIKELHDSYNDLNEKVSSKSVMESLNNQVAEEYGEDVTFADLVGIKNTKFDDMGSFELIEQHLLFEDPEISDEEINAEMIDFDLMTKTEGQISKMIEDEDITQNQYDLVKAKMTRRARAAKNALMEYQDSINLEEFEFHAPKSADVDNQPQQTPEELKEELDYYSSKISELQGIKVDVGSKEKPFELNIEVSEEDRNGIEDFLKVGEDGKNFINKRWIGEDGKVDIETLSKDVHKFRNYERDLKVAFTQGKSAGLKDAVKDTDNIDLNSKTGSKSGTGDATNVHAQISKEINNEQS